MVRQVVLALEVVAERPPWLEVINLMTPSGGVLVYSRRRGFSGSSSISNSNRIRTRSPSSLGTTTFQARTTFPSCCWTTRPESIIGLGPNRCPSTYGDGIAPVLNHLSTEPARKGSMDNTGTPSFSNCTSSLDASRRSHFQPLAGTTSFSFSVG